GRIKCDNAVTFWIAHLVGKNGRAVVPLDRFMQQLLKSMTKEKIITKDQCHTIVQNKIPTDQECLCKTFRPWLHGILKVNSPLFAIAEKTLKLGAVFRSRDNEYFADSGKHERRQRIVDHRLVVDRQ